MESAQAPPDETVPSPRPVVEAGRSRTSPRPTVKGHRACFECRRKKTKCDMRQPTCGLCERTGGSCSFPTKRKAPEIRRPAASHGSDSRLDPRKLERLVDLLELRLKDGQDVDSLVDQAPAMHHLAVGSSSTEFHPSTPMDETVRNHSTTDEVTDKSGSTTKTPSSVLPSHHAGDTASPELSVQSMRGYDAAWWLTVPDFVLSELIYLFFDKIQGWLPLLHRPRFFGHYLRNGVFCKSNFSSISTTDSLLLCGVFALAARHSSNAWFQGMAAQDRGQRFADDALKYYEMSRTSEEISTLNHLQGCILLTFYLYTTGPSHCGWILAGVCVRLAYELNLCNMDEQQDDPPHPDDWSYVEEQRRAFWLVWEVDTFGSIMSRRPSSINRSMMAVRLPVADAAWFADTPVHSPVIDPRPSKVWRILLDSPNENEWAWYIVANFLMTVASEFAGGRHTSQRDEDELVNSITCLSHIISKRFSLESLDLLEPNDTAAAAKHNWLVGMHLMLLCARSTVRASFTPQQRPQFLGLARHLSRVCFQWQPEYIILSHPFLACCLLSDLAYPSEDVFQDSDTSSHNNEVVDLVLEQYASVWKLGSVIADLRSFLTHGESGLPVASLEKRFALYFPSPVKSRRFQDSRDGQSSSLLGTTPSARMERDNKEPQRVISEAFVGTQGFPHHLPQFTEQTYDYPPEPRRAVAPVDLASAAPAGGDDVLNFLHFYGLDELQARS